MLIGLVLGIAFDCLNLMILGFYFEGIPLDLVERSEISA